MAPKLDSYYKSGCDAASAYCSTAPSLISLSSSVSWLSFSLAESAASEISTISARRKSSILRPSGKMPTPFANFSGASHLKSQVQKPTFFSRPYKWVLEESFYSARVLMITLQRSAAISVLSTAILPASILPVEVIMAIIGLRHHP